MAGIVLAVTGASLAEPVSPDRARKIAQGWRTISPRPVATDLPKRERGLETFADGQGQALYHVIHLEPSGFVIVAGDDEVQPIIAFASEGSFDASGDNPLAILVHKDLAGRIGAVRNTAQRGSPAGAERRAHIAKVRGKWRHLAGEVLPTGESGLPTQSSAISDIRVAPLVQSRWNQGSLGSDYCYNYYTPSHYVCGCTATALAQLLRYHQHPVAGIGVQPFSIAVNSVWQTAYTRGGDGSGGPYEWSLMPLIPTSAATTAQRRAIGALCYDAGVAVSMQYASSGSGAWVRDCKAALVNVFGYTNAIRFGDGYSSIDDSLETMLNPSLDAGYPCLLGVSNATVGHAIVADGYGYDMETLYHHLNLGWGGTQDAWYNLPTVDTSYGTFTIVDECVYNVFVTGSGEIISGRVTDSLGEPLAGVAVTAVRSSGGTYSAVTNDNGIYALAGIPPASTYSITAVKEGYDFASRLATTATSTDGISCGNVWGVDFAVVVPSPPTAIDASITTRRDTPVEIVLGATDDGLPNPPAALTFTITSLPKRGMLLDPLAGPIQSVPYTLVGNSRTVTYDPGSFAGLDGFTFTATDSGVPPTGGPSNPASVLITVNDTVYSARMDSDPGWILDAGWAWGTPTGAGSAGGDPTAGFSGPYVMGYNLNGNYENNLLQTRYARTPAINCLHHKDVVLRFQRWLMIESSTYDHANVQVSTDLVTWTDVWSHSGSSLTARRWILQEIDISSIADHQPSVYIRFGMGPTDGSMTYPGWNIDDVEVIAMPNLAGDINGDGYVNVGDLQLLVSAWGSRAGPPADGNWNPNADFNADGYINISDLQLLVTNWGLSL